MAYLGDFTDGETIYGYFSTHDSNGANVAPDSQFEGGDIVVYKDGAAGELTTGISITSPFDSRVGFHSYSIDTTQTGYSTGSDYAVVLVPSIETIDGQTITAVLLDTFSIENRHDAAYTRIGAAGASLTDLGGMSTGMQTQVGTAVATHQLADAASAHGTIPTVQQALYEVVQQLQESVASGTTISVKKQDGTTELMTLTVNDATNPTSIARTT